MSAMVSTCLAVNSYIEDHSISSVFYPISISSQTIFTTMALKRKRSESNISPSSTSSSFSSSTSRAISTSPSPFCRFPSHDMSKSNHYSSVSSSRYSDDSCPQLHSRTRKRHRSKPDESTIHGTANHVFRSSHANIPCREDLPDFVCRCPVSTSTQVLHFIPARSKFCTNL